MDTAIREGKAEGKAEGLAEGLAEGRIEGRMEGLAEGEKKKQQDIARNMKALGLDPEVIAKATGLTSEEISYL